MTERGLTGLVVSAVLLTLVAGCADAPLVSRPVKRAVLGELFVISD
jgi:hypothetical protein